jgi:hypothetical protein
MSPRIDRRVSAGRVGLSADLLGVAAILLGLAALVGSVGYVISVSRPTGR